MDFKGRTALVTGAGMGIGRAVAIKLAQNGANLAIVDIDAEKLKALKDELRDYTDKVIALKCDVSDETRAYAAVKTAAEALGDIDILINNAALWRCRSLFTDTPAEQWRRFIDVNIMGVVYFTKAVLPKMIENGFGRIINVASVAGVYGNAYMAHYSATKGAVISMTKALAKEVAAHGVLVNCVSPGSVSPSDHPDVNYYEKSDLSFIGRTGTDMENANLICFLASDEASYISGQNIQIDGCRKKQ